MTRLGAIVVDAGTCPERYEERHDTSHKVTHAYGTEKGGWIDLLWEVSPHGPYGPVEVRQRRIWVTRIRALQEMASLLRRGQVQP